MVKTNIVVENRRLKRALNRAIKENRKIGIGFMHKSSQLFDEKELNSHLKDSIVKLTGRIRKLEKMNNLLIDKLKASYKTDVELTTMNGA